MLEMHLIYDLCEENPTEWPHTSPDLGDAAQASTMRNASVTGTASATAQSQA